MPLIDPWATLHRIDHDESLDAWRAELIDGQLLLTGPPSVGHQRIISDFTRQLIRSDPDDRLTFWAVGAGCGSARQRR